MTITETEQSSTDGRHRRAQASREAIVESLVSLYADGYVDPSAAEIAERAGVSERSLFRHFDDIDDLCHTAFVIQWKRLAERTRLPMSVTSSTDEKIVAIVEQRVGLYLDMMNVMRITRMHAVPINALMSFEHVEQLRVDQGMPTSRIVSTLVSALSCLFVDASR